MTVEGTPAAQTNATPEGTSVESQTTQTPPEGQQTQTPPGTEHQSTGVFASQTTEPPESQDPPDASDTPAERIVPEADGYKLPEGVPVELGQWANQNGMTQEQLDATISQFGQYVQNQSAAEQGALRKMGEDHLNAWGENKDYNLSLARRALQQNDPDGNLKQLLDSSGYGNHPAVLDFFLKIGTSMQEGGYLKSAVNRPQTKKSAAQAMFGENHPSVG